MKIKIRITAMDGVRPTCIKHGSLTAVYDRVGRQYLVYDDDEARTRREYTLFKDVLADWTRQANHHVWAG